MHRNSTTVDLLALATGLTIIGAAALIWRYADRIAAARSRVFASEANADPDMQRIGSVVFGLFGCAFVVLAAMDLFGMSF